MANCGVFWDNWGELVNIWGKFWGSWGDAGEKLSPQC